MSKHNTLQGLNVIHPPLPQSDPDLLAAPAFPDLTEQLELWTNLTFENDDNNSQEGRYCPPGVDYDDLDEEDEATVQAHHPAPHDAHVNVVTGTAVPQQSNLAQFNNNNSASNLSLAQYLQGGLQNAQQGQHQSAPQSNADLLSMLASIGVDPFASSHNQNHHQSALPPLPPPTTLAQLLALQNAQASSSLSSSSSASISAADQIPASKRARSRKSSVSTTLTTEDDHSGSSPGASGSGSGSASSPPTTVAAEDKRKRNTAASARFRQKKKEREAALEQKAKELESKVSELERECEGLRRENGWLKGLVIGVTGAAQSQQQQQQQQHHQGVNSPTTGAVSAGVKRPREEGTEVSPL